MEKVTSCFIRKISRELARELRLVGSYADQKGLTVAEAHALIELGEHGMLSVQQVAQLLLIDAANASRAVQSLILQKLAVLVPEGPPDRAKGVALTEAGHRRLAEVHGEMDSLVRAGLDQLTPGEQKAVADGLMTYARGLRYSRLQEGFIIRPVRPADNAAVAEIIRSVSQEHGLTAEAGYAVGDVAVDAVSQAYAADGACYWVVEHQGRVLGGGGVAPLAGCDGSICELQKMYLLAECRGRGLGRRLVLTALEFARSHGYRACYLETTGILQQAARLYESLGFERCTAQGDTGHSVCELRYIMHFTTQASSARGEHPPQPCCGCGA
jgi:putative acetyltransferase